MMESADFPKYLVIKCVTLDQLTAAMSSIDSSFPIEHVRVATDLAELTKDTSFINDENSSYKDDEDEASNGEANTSNYGEPPLEIAEENGVSNENSNNAPVEIKEEPKSPMRDEEPMEENEPSKPLPDESVFMAAFLNDHCYTSRVKAEPESEDYEPIEVVDARPPHRESTSFHHHRAQETHQDQSTSHRDYIRSIGEQPQYRRKYQRKQDPEAPGKKRTLYGDVQCNVCGTSIAVKGKDWHAKSAHAIIHTNIERYHCPICELYGSRHRAEVARHIERVHEVKTKGITIQEDMSPDDILELRNMVSICFGTSMNKRGKLQTQLLNFYEEQLGENG